MVKSNVEKTAAERSDSSYRGIRKRKWGKWVSEIRLPNSRQRIWLGSYDSAVKAARAFDAATFCLRGGGAKFNFPDDPPDIAGGRSMTPSQIQDAAARFANSVRPVNTPIETPSSSVRTTLLPMESPSPALSDGTFQTDSGVAENGCFKEMVSVNGSGYCVPDYSIFPGFDYFGGDFYVPELPSYDYGDENIDGLIIHNSFLWNF
ncbi:ethylene-responsive transcription factor ERF017-like [Cicer arietinum]|uniref:Ethylene-responsive transcription factor ERF017-like n=1 Tax=Cicer arietinum TaxID=3827 RepID=A0A1S2XEH0_CICAR|nr:ethylene-responsive transcription factor ERF017-like [Cicer arietinum]